MTGKSNIELRLRGLLNRGSLARSDCSTALLGFLAPLLASGVVDWQRRGAGRRLVVRNPESLRGFIAQQFPHSDGALSSGASRVQGVARFRDSKSLRNDSPEVVCIRGWRDGALKTVGKPVPLAAATREFGVFAFVLSEPGRFTLSGRCALVENPAVFSAAERLGLSLDLVLLGRGRCSNALLDWLSQQSALQLVHMPDYDPIGLREYERIRLRLGERIALHAPANLGELFARYANPELLLNPISQAALAALRRGADPEVLRIAALINRYNAGLEQEALLLS